MTKARSRLPTSTKTKSRPEKNRLQKKIQLPIFQTYLKHWPALILGLFFSTCCGFILTKIFPNQIQHWLVPNAYFPFLLNFFLASFFLTSFILLNTRRGFLLSFGLTTLVFFRLQQVIFEFNWFLLLIGGVVTLELMINLVRAIKDR